MNTFRKYVWLLNTLQNAHYGLTLKEIQEEWLESGDYESAKDNTLHERTLHRWRQGILSTFGIEIVCDKEHEYRYKIDDDLDETEKAQVLWMCHAVTLGGVMNDYKDQHKNILVESVPSGEKFLRPILQAIKTKKKLKIVYHSFKDAEPGKPETIHPLCLRLFERRWYALVKFESAGYVDAPIRIIALDRIVQMDPLKAKFSLPGDFDAETYFQYDYGIAVGVKEAPCKIRIKVNDRQRPYTLSLPLHPSQKEVEHQDGYSIFEYYLKPTNEFARALLPFGQNYEVLEPASLRKKVHDFAIEAANANK